MTPAVLQSQLDGALELLRRTEDALFRTLARENEWRLRAEQLDTELRHTRRHGARPWECSAIAEIRNVCEGHELWPCTTMHFHGCPHCYEDEGCWLLCTIEPDISDAGHPRGSYLLCSRCSSMSDLALPGTTFGLLLGKS